MTRKPPLGVGSRSTPAEVDAGSLAPRRARAPERSAAVRPARPGRRARRSSATRRRERSGTRPRPRGRRQPPDAGPSPSAPTSSWAIAPCSRNHGFCCSRTSAASSSLRRLAQLDVASPAAEPRLEHDGELGNGGRERRAEERGVRVRQSGEPKRPGGQQLVVGDDQGCREDSVRPRRRPRAARARRCRSRCRRAASRTSSLASATSPGSRDVSAVCGSSCSESRPQARAAATSASFVALRRWATTANFMPKSCGLYELKWDAIR